MSRIPDEDEYSQPCIPGLLSLLLGFLQALGASLFNPLRANFFRGDINIYLHLMSLLHIDMIQVLKILLQVRPGLTYST